MQSFYLHIVLTIIKNLNLFSAPISSPYLLNPFYQYFILHLRDKFQIQSCLFDSSSDRLHVNEPHDDFLTPSYPHRLNSKLKKPLSLNFSSPSSPVFLYNFSSKISSFKKISNTKLDNFERSDHDKRQNLVFMGLIKVFVHGSCKIRKLVKIC